MARRKNGQRENVWRSRLARFERSDLTVAEFCRREGVSAPSFYQWRKRLDRSQGDAMPAARQDLLAEGKARNFIPLVVSSAAVAEVEFPNGMRVRVPTENVEALRAAIVAGAEVCREVS